MRFRIEVSGSHENPVEQRGEFDAQVALFVGALRSRGYLVDAQVVDLCEPSFADAMDAAEVGLSFAREDTWPTKVLVPRGTPVLSKEDMGHAKWIDPPEGGTAEEMAALAAETGAAVDEPWNPEISEEWAHLADTEPSLAEKIRIARAENAHLGQRELAEMFGVSRYAIKKALG